MALLGAESPVLVLWWVFAVATYGVGDVVTTVYGTRQAGLRERMPLVRYVAGEIPAVSRLVGLKVVAMGGGYLLSWLLVARSHRALVPALLSLLGVVVVVLNLWQIRASGNERRSGPPGG